ncbi:ABC transporter permease [Patulibacter brassicae]|jgi:ABC-2 type transport system permease protein|uniref:Transport permease protein n=1 Tax=Patulibacter brassicae TaxID=1705717 RepID=A0ABU4VJN5_9ACTN|nr:ABC transporter permease [Patulibacter brassicae]MDX8151650.1 ABC transporter permease [Patulibacter brassicae]
MSTQTQPRTAPDHLAPIRDYDDELPLRLMPGPGALGGGWRRFAHLTWTIAVTDFRLTYFGSALGYLWSLARPLLLFAVLYTVFTEVAKFGDEIPNYPVLLLMNIMFYNFFADATNTAVTSLVVRETLVRKMQFPRAVIPLAVVTTAALNLLSAMVVVVLFMLVYGVDPTWTWLLLPVGLAPLVLLAVGVALLVSGLYVRFRDVQPIYAVISTALFYGSPVLYTIDNVDGPVKEILSYNPLTGILEQMRAWMVDPTAPGGITALGGWTEAIPAVAIAIGICALGVWVFDREARGAAERL